MKYKVGFIGVGNMGSALLKAVSSSIENCKIAIYDTDREKAGEIAVENGFDYVAIETVASESEYVFLGVKPDVVAKVAETVKSSISGSNILVSMAAGIDIAYLENAFSTDRIIRIMPNTPVSVFEGMVLYSVGAGITTDIELGFVSLLSGAGKLDKLDEKYMDAAAALSGCGPAFVYMFVDALADGAVKCGLPRDKALLYAKQTIMGSGAMMLASDKHPDTLKDEVCSPGGTTIEGVITLEKGKFRYNVSSAVISAYNKTSELKK